ncbi:SRPBCC family protein [Nocardioides sp. WS12]|uniref:type II toxin-antitoxin system Rv0910 family toxin n=1 Tax=Nocardioides sp. WS12 TaxID=2486272 RepID=UPI0015FCC4CC|nr:SRPBCC family protein [Nocardioides sp. WS12]
MAQTNASLEIPAAKTDIWGIISDPSSYEKWLTLHTKWKDEPPTELALGTQMTEVVSIMGMPNTITWNVDAYEAPKSLTISGTGMAGAKVTFTLSVEGGNDSSVATIDAEFISQMMVGAIGAAVERTAAKELDQSLANLSALVA